MEPQQNVNEFRSWHELSEKERSRVFSGENYAPLPASHAERIEVLLGIKAVEFARETLKGVPGYSSTATTSFQREESLSLANCWTTAAGIQTVREWLHARSVPYSTKVYLLYNEAAVATEWKILVKYWDAFAWCIGVEMLVLDSTKSWVCEFHHEDVVTFRRYL